MSDEITTEVPWSDRLTDYDHAHHITYLRMLDAHAESAEPDEMALFILRIDPRREPARARRAVQSHLRRALWMTEYGYRELLLSGRQEPFHRPI
jgi:hypothetical protein